VVKVVKREDEKGQKEYLRSRTMDYSTGEERKLKRV
jgi:hypothetical protein